MEKVEPKLDRVIVLDTESKMTERETKANTPSPSCFLPLPHQSLSTARNFYHHTSLGFFKSLLSHIFVICYLFGTIRRCYNEQFANKLNNLQEMDKFIYIYNL